MACIVSLHGCQSMHDLVGDSVLHVSDKVDGCCVEKWHLPVVMNPGSTNVKDAEGLVCATKTRA